MWQHLPFLTFLLHWLAGSASGQGGEQDGRGYLDPDGFAGETGAEQDGGGFLDPDG